MRQMRWLLALLAATAILLFATGCGGDATTDEAASETATTETATTETVATTTDEDTVMDTSSSDTDASATTKVVRITVKGGAPVGGIVRASVTKGDKVTLVVTSDVADEVHLHGYDLMKDVEAGGTVRLTFVAKLPGRFEAELEDAGAQIAELTVNP